MLRMKSGCGDPAERGRCAALAAAHQVGGPVGEGLAAAARAAFVHGVSDTDFAGLAVALAGAVVALASLLARASRARPNCPPCAIPRSTLAAPGRCSG